MEICCRLPSRQQSEQFLSITGREFRQGKIGRDSRSDVIRIFGTWRSPRVHIATGTEDSHDGQGDGDVIARDVGFHLVHDVGVEALSASMGWSCDVVLDGKGDLCVFKRFI